MIAVVCICLLFAFIWYCNREPAWAIHPSVNVYHGIVTVRNRNDFNWQQVCVAINPSGLTASMDLTGKVHIVLQNGYFARIAVVRRHGEIRLSPNDFVDNHGSRWNPTLAKPQTIQIDCSDRTGRGIYSWQGYF